MTAENAADQSEKWKVIFREVLLEIYGNTIANYSATGKLGERPGIYPMLFKGLFGKLTISNLKNYLHFALSYLFFLHFRNIEWANEQPGGVLDKKKFITHINKTAANKRKYRNRKSSLKECSFKEKRQNSSKNT